LCKKIGWIGNLYKEQGLDCKKGATDSDTHEGKDWFANIAKLRSHLQFSHDLTGFWISFSNEKGVSRVHSPWTATPAGPQWTHDRDRVAHSPVHGA
jgi:hypothetical protein